MDQKASKNKKKIVVIGTLVVVTLFAMYLAFFQNNEVKVPDENIIIDSEDIINDVDGAKNDELNNIENEENEEETDEAIDENISDVEPIIDKVKQEEEYFGFINEGLKFKSEGDAGNKDSYYKSIEAYQKASDVAGGKVWIPYLNLGNVYRLVADFENAEKSYDKALEITTEGTVYKAKIDMYRYELKKSEEEMIVIYEDAIENVVDNADLMKNYAAYLRDIERYADSLKYWKLISDKFPAEQMYKDEVSELEARLK